MSTPTAIYRHWQNHILLYVGISRDPKARYKQHMAYSVWADQITNVDVFWLPSREAAMDAEREAIAAEGPLFNGGPRMYLETGDALRDWMARNRINQQQIADKHGITQATVSRMISGKCLVSLRFAASIEDWSKGEVPVRYWLYGVTADGKPQSEATA